MPDIKKSPAPVMLLRYLLSWLTVRPRRWFFRRCLFEGGQGVRWLPVRREGWDNYNYHEDRELRPWERFKWPNFHWVFAYRTVFAFFKWLYWDGWRPLCRWGPHCRETFPWYARLVQKIGRTTAGVTISGGECYHCASAEGNPVDLADDETETTFILLEFGSSATMDGTNYWFRGETICPKCGFHHEYRDDSL